MRGLGGVSKKPIPVAKKRNAQLCDKSLLANSFMKERCAQP